MKITNDEFVYNVKRLRGAKINGGQDLDFFTDIAIDSLAYIITNTNSKKVKSNMNIVINTYFKIEGTEINGQWDFKRDDFLSLTDIAKIKGIEDKQP